MPVVVGRAASLIEEQLTILETADGCFSPLLPMSIPVTSQGRLRIGNCQRPTAVLERSMDVFYLRDKLIDDYKAYSRSFVKVRDPRIWEYVDKELESGALWPDPLIQLNPRFEETKTVGELAGEGLLHPLCGDIIRFDKRPEDPKGIVRPLHRHQIEAIEASRAGDSYVLITGTGSGKSLAYIIPIVDYVLKNKHKKGIKAVVIYPMNALANSQLGELRKFLEFGFDKPPVTFARYAGQENDEQRNEIKANPRDILLTNYVMLEYIMTRPDDAPLVRQMKGMQFLVLDELHTYRGRQGADVAMLVRRVRNVAENPTLQVVGRRLIRSRSSSASGPGRLSKRLQAL